MRFTESFVEAVRALSAKTDRTGRIIDKLVGGQKAQEGAIPKILTNIHVLQAEAESLRQMGANAFNIKIDMGGSTGRKRRRVTTGAAADN